jgi:hypothetical protein
MRLHIKDRDAARRPWHVNRKGLKAAACECYEIYYPNASRAFRPTTETVVMPSPLCLLTWINVGQGGARQEPKRR